MFYSVNKRKLSQIVLSLMALMSVLITLKLINKNNNDFLIKIPIDSMKPSNVKPRIFCMITTREENHETKAIHVRNTWAKRCDQFLFLSSANDTGLPAIKLCEKDDRSHLWCKTKSGFHYIHDNYVNQFDWFLKADDDTYVVLENLRSFLSNHSPESAVYFGCKFKLKNVVYMSGGAGYVLSREALRRFVFNSLANSTDSSQCKAHAETGAEDFELGRCLQSLNVTAGDSRDKSLQPRFFPFDPSKIVSPSTNFDALAPWFKTYSVYPHKSGPDCCSPTLISFHYVPKDLMYLIEFLLYNVTVVQ